MRQRLFRGLLLLVLIGGYPLLATGQESSSPFDWRSVVSGSVGSEGEFYGVSGIDGRRPPASARVFANASFDLLGLQSGIRLTYSTDNSELRQSLNRLGFATTWRFLHVAAGDVSPSLSSFSVNGETMRGGYIDLTPGPLVLSAAAGRSRGAIEPGPSLRRTPAYERWLYAGRLGLGSESGTHFHLIGMLGRDDASSLEQAGLDLKAQENLLVASDAGLSLFDDAFSLSGEVAVSAFTRDQAAEPLDEIPVPGFMTDLFTPRVSSSADWAARASMDLDLSAVDLTVGIDRVQPGFRSMGRPQVQSDRQTIRVKPTLRLLGGRMRLAGRFAHTTNNLLGNRIATLERSQFGFNATGRISQALSLTGSYQRLVNANVPTGGTAADSLLSQRQVVQSVMLTPALSFRSGGTTHNITLASSFQQLADESEAVRSGMRPGVGSLNVSSTLSYVISLSSGLSINAGGNVLYNDTDRATTTVLGLNAGSSVAVLERKLTLALNAGYSATSSELEALAGNEPASSSSSQYNLSGNATYRLWTGGSVRMSVRGLASEAGADRSFQEVRAALRYEQRF